MDYSHFRQELDSLTKALAEGKWEQAVTHLRVGQRLVETVPGPVLGRVIDYDELVYSDFILAVSRAREYLTLGAVPASQPDKIRIMLAQIQECEHVIRSSALNLS